ncbi:MAG: hypothetical protein Q8P66_00610, partial [Candidatus Colwellbacteria bacterium]|nr:hypothetical protein [Candidatus Colwellbacteria bacterium]
MSACAGAGRAADAMDVIPGVGRDVIVKDKPDPDNLNPPRGNVGCDKHAMFSGFKSLKGASPLGERSSGVNLGGVMPHGADCPCQPARRVFCYCENKGCVGISLQYFLEEPVFGVPLDYENFLRYS